MPDYAGVWLLFCSRQYFYICLMMKLPFILILMVVGGSPSKEERHSLIDKLSSTVHDREALSLIFGDSAMSLMEVMDCKPCPLS